MDTNLVVPLGPRKCLIVFDYFLEASLILRRIKSSLRGALWTAKKCRWKMCVSARVFNEGSNLQRITAEDTFLVFRNQCTTSIVFSFKTSPHSKHLNAFGEYENLILVYMNMMISLITVN